MAFNSANWSLGPGGQWIVPNAASGTARQYGTHKKWTYTTSDTPITVYTAGYFADVGSTSGTSALSLHDEIEVTFSSLYTKTFIVTDERAGTVQAKDIKTMLLGEYDAASITTGDVITGFQMSEYCVIIGFKAIVLTAITTTPCSVAFNLEINTTNVTGGSVAITAAKAIDAIVSGTAITAGNVVYPTYAIDLEAAVTTAFTEGKLAFIIQYF